MSFKKARFMANNFAEVTSISPVVSSEDSDFPFSNASNNPFRFQVYKPLGNFTIDSTNNKIYINDGSDKTITLSSANYAGGDALATHIQTQLNASSSNWTVSYSSTTYNFTISNTGSVTLRLSEQTNATWDTIGYVTSVDKTDTSFEADEQRNHTSEFITYDFQDNPKITFISLLGPLPNRFTISSSATITIKANNINDFDNPPIDETIPIQIDGAYGFFNEEEEGYRFWKIEIIDKYNPSGPQFEIGHIYFGTYETLSYNISNNFTHGFTDRSEVSEAVSGAKYFDEKAKVFYFSNMGVNYISQEDRDKLKKLFNKNGITKPFYFSLDPGNEISDEVSEFTKYVQFTDSPVFEHVVFDKFIYRFDLLESF